MSIERPSGGEGERKFASERIKSEIEAELQLPLEQMSDSELRLHLDWLETQLRWPALNGYPELEQKIKERISAASKLYAHNGEGFDEENGRIADRLIEENNGGAHEKGEAPEPLTEEERAKYINFGLDETALKFADPELVREQIKIHEEGLAKNVPPEIEIPTFVQSAGEVAPEPHEEKEGIPLMITQEMRQKLEDLGFHDWEIRDMKPEEAWEILKSEDKAENNKETPEHKEEEISQEGRFVPDPTTKVPTNFSFLKSESKPEKVSAKSWDEMTEEERREKYGRTFDIREKLVALQKAREEAVSNPAAKAKYEQAKAEYVGAKAWRLLKEKQKMAEEEALQHEKGLFEKFRKGWRWLGEQNLEKLGWKPTSKVGKFFSRTLSARTAASLGLLAGGVALGAGSAVGIGAIAMRRIFAGASTGLGVYDLARMSDERKAIRNIEEDLKAPDRLPTPHLEQALAEMEARAKYSGESVLNSAPYQELRREYSRRLESQTEKDEAIKQALESTNLSLEKEQGRTQSRERRMKLVGLAAGAVVGSGALAEAFKGIKELLPWVTEDEVRSVIDKSPALSKETAGELMPGDSTKLPPFFTPADSVPADSAAAGASPHSMPNVVPPDSIDKVVSDTTTQVAPDTALTKTVPGAPKVDVTPNVAVAESAAGTIDQGQNAWVAARELVKSGQITEEQFQEAWGSIADKGLTHAGDVVKYVPEANGVPAHFEIMDNPNDAYKVGTNEDLARAFDNEGIKRPDWLQRALGVAEPQAVTESALPELELGAIDHGTDQIRPLESPEFYVEEAMPAEQTTLGVQAEFKKGLFGGINELKLMEAPGQPLTTSEINSLYKDSSLYNMKVPAGMELETAKMQIADNSRKLALMKRFLENMAKIDKLDSPEAKFVLKGAKQILESSRMFFGDIYKPNLF